MKIPRVVSNGERAYAIIIANYFTNYDALLYDILKSKMVPIKFADPGTRYGKNWQPFLDGDELYFVHELVPFRIMKVDVETGRTEVVREVDVTFNLSCFHTPYSMFRGGCNAVVKDKTIFGMGRATSQRYRHHPFLWSLDESDHLEILFSEFFSDFHVRGYNIIDPTSLFIVDDDIYLGLCCSERDWAHTQVLSNFLLRFPQSAPSGEFETLANFFKGRAKTESARLPSIERNMFFCIEMPSAISSKQKYGGRVSTGEPGCLVYGPYVKIENEGRYSAELSYLTAPSSRPQWATSLFPRLRQGGAFDVTVSRYDENDKLVDFKTLGRVNLPDTDGNMGEARIDFDTTGLRGYILETRVFVNKGVELNAYHVRTWGHAMASDAESAFPWSPLQSDPEVADAKSEV